MDRDESAVIEPYENELEEVRSLFREYEAFLGVDLCFQDFERELAELPGKYAPPTGALLLARVGGYVAGCVALRDLGEGACEMKRLFVRPGYRGHGLGRTLAVSIVSRARAIGYLRMRLDTFDFLDGAVHIYESLGFARIGSYYENPHEKVQYWELALSHPRDPA